MIVFGLSLKVIGSSKRSILGYYFHLLISCLVLQSIADNAGNDVTANEGAPEERAEDRVDQVGSSP